ncbi:hypothetical protein K466DRAFT_49017 [Polyporus arcularius HHB13444]|uniref:Uncharacterized protein n=1 Tax=Polyporus arcularius HHB13444 TaxID=1314778 RepID=A0A5C3PW76_9APHY|nr:hypothetical protein K466DRAFT_49017 [Polyporus arcularius HHB13444]
MRMRLSPEDLLRRHLPELDSRRRNSLRRAKLSILPSRSFCKKIGPVVHLRGAAPFHRYWSETIHAHYLLWHAGINNLVPSVANIIVRFVDDVPESVLIDWDTWPSYPRAMASSAQALGPSWPSISLQR